MGLASLVLLLTRYWETSRDSIDGSQRHQFYEPFLAISDHDLPQTTQDALDPDDVCKIVLEERSIPVTEQDLRGVEMLNAEQRTAFDAVLDRVSCNRPGVSL